MEEVVRKRVVGAVVLVVIGIMLPLLLSRCLHDPAPDGQAMRVYEITPSGGIEPVDGGMAQADKPPASSEAPAAAPDAVEAPPVADENAAEPEPELQSEPEPTITEEPKTAAPVADAQKPSDTVKSAAENSVAEAPPQTTTAAASPANATDLEHDVAAGSWIVQVASFAKEQNAQALAQQLDEAYTVFYTPAQVNDETWYRVRIGPFDGEAGANNAAAELRAQGRDTLVMQVD